MLTLSLIIPAYNEERHIKACLEAVSRQTVAPLEVLLIDNNCTDKTLDYAKKYDFVRIITEKKQGLIYSRNTGFNTANGDILGRIDADSEILSDWVELTIANFTKDKKLMGITGLARTSFIPYVKRFRSIWMSQCYFWFIHGRNRVDTMWGANMAIRREAWSVVKDSICLDDQVVHEDQDLSLCMGAEGLKVKIDNKMLIETSGQSYRYLPKLKYYGELFKSTRAHHISMGSFDSKKLVKLNSWSVIPSLIIAYLTGFAIIFSSIILFPLDYYFIHNGHQHHFD